MYKLLIGFLFLNLSCKCQVNGTTHYIIHADRNSPTTSGTHSDKFIIDDNGQVFFKSKSWQTSLGAIDFDGKSYYLNDVNKRIKISQQLANLLVKAYYSETYKVNPNYKSGGSGSQHNKP